MTLLEKSSESNIEYELLEQLHKIELKKAMDDKVDLVNQGDSKRDSYGTCDFYHAENVENYNPAFDENSEEDSGIKSINLADSNTKQLPGMISDGRDVGDDESQTLKGSGDKLPSYVEEDNADECRRIEDVADQRPWWRILLEALVPFLCSGLGLSAAGLVLDAVQVRIFHWH